MKKILSAFLVLLILLSLTATSVFAGSSPFDPVTNCEDYSFEITGENECTIVEYKGTDKRIAIPETLEDYTVTAIGENAFAFNYYLTSVKFPDTIKTIGDNAFFYCYNLSSVTIPDSVESIGEKAFGYNRRNFDTDTCTYTYRADPAFTVYATANSTGAKFATDNGYELNEDELYNDFVTSISFNIPNEWKTFNNIYCHIWDLETGKSFTTWQSELEKCDVYYDHVNYADNKGFSLNYDTVYGIVFSTDTGEVTAPAVYIAPLFLHTLTTDGTYITTSNDETPRLLPKWWTGREYMDLSAYEEAFGLFEDSVISTEDEPSVEATYDEALPWGDSNCDGSVNIKDATAIQKHVAEIESLSENGIILSNFINKDTLLSIRNATELQKYCAGLRTLVIIGEPAVSRVSIETPHAWARQYVYALSWSDPEDVTVLPIIDGAINVPIYNNNIALRCNDYTTQTWTLDFYTNDDNGNSQYVCEAFNDSDTEFTFIWTLWD